MEDKEVVGKAFDGLGNLIGEQQETEDESEGKESGAEDWSLLWWKKKEAKEKREAQKGSSKS